MCSKNASYYDNGTATLMVLRGLHEALRDAQQ